MPFSNGMRRRIFDEYIAYSSRGEKFPEEKWEYIKRVEPGMLGELRQAATDYRASQRNADASPNLRQQGVLARTAGAALDNPSVRKQLEHLDEESLSQFLIGPASIAQRLLPDSIRDQIPGIGDVIGAYGAASANLPLSTSKDSVPDGLFVDIAEGLAGRAIAPPKIDLLTDPAIDSPLPGDFGEGAARAGGQAAAELAMLLPGVGSATQGAIETQAPAILDIPRRFGRALVEFAIGGPALATASATTGAYAEGGTADEAAVAGLATAAGGTLGRGMNATAVKASAAEGGAMGLLNQAAARTVSSGRLPGTIAGEAGASALIDLPSSLALNPDIAADLADGRELSDEQQARLIFELAMSGAGTLAGVTAGMAEGHGLRKEQRRIADALAEERKVLKEATARPEYFYDSKIDIEESPRAQEAQSAEQEIAGQEVIQPETINTAAGGGDSPAPAPVPKDIGPTSPAMLRALGYKPEAFAEAAALRAAGQLAEAEAMEAQAFPALRAAPLGRREASDILASDILDEKIDVDAVAAVMDFQGQTAKSLRARVASEMSGVDKNRRSNYGRWKAAERALADAKAFKARAGEGGFEPPGDAPLNPWQMTREQFAAEYVLEGTKGKTAFGNMSKGDAIGARDAHKKAIAKAIDDGKEVPARVLEEYPDLKEKMAATLDSRIAEAGRELTLAKHNVSIDDFATENEVLGRMFNMIRDAPDSIRGQMVRRIQTAGEVSRNIKQAAGLELEAYRAARNAEVERLVQSGAVRDQVEADALVKSVEGQRAYGQAARQLDALAEAHAAGRQARAAALRQQAASLGLALDSGDEAVFTQAMRPDALFQVATAAMYGQPATRLARATDKALRLVGKGVRFGRLFSNDAAVLSAAAADGDWRAGQAMALLTQARNSENEMKTVLKVGFHNLIDRAPMTSKDYEFVNSRQEDWLSYMGGERSREDLVERLRAYGYKDPEESVLVKVYDAWNGALDASGLKKNAAGVLRSIGVNTRDNYFPHKLHAHIQDRLRGKGSEERNKAIADLVRADMLERVKKGEFEPDSPAARKRADILSAALKAAFDPEAINKGASLAELARTLEEPMGTAARGSIKDPAMASLIKTRELELPEFLEDGTPVLVRDPMDLIETYINGISRVAGIRTALGSDDTGIPTRLIPLYKSMEEGKPKDAVDSLYRELSMGMDYRGGDAMERMVFDPSRAPKARAVVNAISNVARAILVSGSHPAQFLSYVPMFQDAGASSFLMGITPVVGKQIVKQAAKDRVLGTRGALEHLRHLKESGAKAPHEDLAIRSYIDMINGLMMDNQRLAHERLQGLADAPELSPEVAPSFSKDKAGYVASRIEAGGTRTARAIHRYSLVSWLNNVINSQASVAAFHGLNVYHGILKNGSAKHRADAAYDLKHSFGISDVKRFIETGPTDLDRINAARSIRSRANASDMSALERPNVAKSWAGRTLYALQSIVMVQSANFSQWLDKNRVRGFGLSGRRAPGKTALALAGGAIAAGLYNEALQTLSGQTQPTDSEWTNLALETAAQQGFMPSFAHDMAYGLRFGDDPYSIIVTFLTGGAPGIMNAGKLANRVRKVGESAITGENMDEELENLRKSIPGVRRYSDIYMSGAEFPERVEDRIDKAIEETEAVEPMVGPLIESLSEIYDLLEEGRSARRGMMDMP